MTASSSRLHRPLAALLAAVLVLSSTPAARATAGTVVADSASGNGIARGRVVRADPDNARVTVTNGFHFWAALDVSYVGGSNFLRPTDPRVDFGGIYAGGGLIGPGGTASWDGRFSAASQALVRVHYDLSSAGGAAALAANLLTIIADSLGASLSASSSTRLLTALQVVTSLSSWADFVRQAQTNDIWGFVTSVKLLLGSETGRDTIRYALAQLGVLVSDAGLVELASVAGIIDWIWTLFDIYRAVLTGQNDGTVIFSVAPPVVTPGPTATATATAKPTATATAGPTAKPTPKPTAKPTPRPTPKPTPKPLTFRVAATDGIGLDPISLTPGQRLRIVASGTWCTGGIKPDGTASCGGPDGIRPAGQDETGVQLPSAPIGALIGRFGAGPWFRIGSIASVVVPHDHYVLMLACNDRWEYYLDNSGSVKVTLTRTP